MKPAPSARQKVTAEQVLAQLHAAADTAVLDGMRHFGIVTDHALGVRLPVIREQARHIAFDHALAQELWDSGVYEARLLASMVDRPELVTPDQMEWWVTDFDSWALCDGVCNDLFAKTGYASATALAWSHRSEEFVRRAGFVLMATLAVQGRSLGDAAFLPFLLRIEEEAGDDREYVRKAVNWALRQIGKRSVPLNKAAIASARRILSQTTKSAHWIATDALRELASAPVMARLKKREKG
jgi:3-methyladenine DNA glycosylase AlkD